MKKADKIKICREFLRSRSLLGTLFDVEGGQPDLFYSNLKELETAIRWGLKHPEELRNKRRFGICEDCNQPIWG